MSLKRIGWDIWVLYARDPDNGKEYCLGIFTNSDYQDSLNGWNDEGWVKQ